MRGKKMSSKISEDGDEAESEESVNDMLDEEQIAEIKIAKLREREKV